MISVSLLAMALSASHPVTAAPCPSPCPVIAAAVPGPRLTSALPRIPLARYFSRGDYPAAALRDRAEGRVGFALAIDANGRVNGCRITASSGSAALDSTTCRILRSRARYTPAHDARGVSVADADIGEMVWTLPSN